MFAEYCDYREREKDPDRYKKNRGCKLAEQLKKFNGLKKRLPAVETKLLADVAEWEGEHGCDFEIKVCFRSNTTILPRPNVALQKREDEQKCFVGYVAAVLHSRAVGGSI